VAENETLDLMDRNSGRWRDLWRLISKGAPEAEIREKAITNLYTTFRKISEDIPVAELLSAAAGEDGDLDELARDCRKHREYAQLFKLESAQGLDRQTVAENVALGVIDRFLDQIGMETMRGSNSFDLAELMDRFRGLKRSLNDPIRRFAHQLARSPDRAPRKPPVSKQAKAQRQKQLLTRSLIGR